ncbi:MAG: trypsin-like peptidase domain-containing protein [Acidobacteria bacterium]|nr:trypsin-like peptidase domain-containing protein [Acidobacteriota bacterium]
MRLAWVMAALLAVPPIGSGQAPGVLHITVTVMDASGTPTAVPRHALLVSDNPATREPRRMLTGADGTVALRLPPGSYTVESDRPVTFLGKAYQWTQMVDVVAGQAVSVVLSSDNAEVLAAPAPPAGAAAVSGTDPSLLLGTWQQSLVAVWSPTARATGFVVDAQGLIATHGRAAGPAVPVAVQWSREVKVPARVLVADPARNVAIIQVDPTVVGGPPLPLPCPPATAPSLDEGQEIVALASPLRTGPDLARGTVTGFEPRAIETDLRLGFGGAGGPAFDEAGTPIGLTSVPGDGDVMRSDAAVVRVGILCEALSAARAKMAGSAPPGAERLPVEPVTPFPAGALEASVKADAGASAPPVASSSDFDIAFLTPPMVHRARQRPDRTGGAGGRAPEAEARLGRLTDFGAWSGYFEDLPSVLVVRVTPKLVEGFWKRIAREAARTQGAVLPAFKDFKTDFLRMRAACGGAEVTPIHPFLLEHRASERSEEDVVREGVYVFAPGAFGPHCGSVTLSLYSGRAPEKPDTLVVDPKVIDRIWRDFAPGRTGAR